MMFREASDDDIGSIISLTIDEAIAMLDAPILGLDSAEEEDLQVDSEEEANGSGEEEDLQVDSEEDANGSGEEEANGSGDDTAAVEDFHIDDSILRHPDFVKLARVAANFREVILKYQDKFKVMLKEDHDNKMKIVDLQERIENQSTLLSSRAQLISAMSQECLDLQEKITAFEQKDERLAEAKLKAEQQRAKYEKYLIEHQNDILAEQGDDEPFVGYQDDVHDFASYQDDEHFDLDFEVRHHHYIQHILQPLDI
jgi:hypothetical protein